MQEQRIIWADSMKGWLMLLVILGHAIQVTLGKETGNNHLWNLIYSFHMPAFMTVSGWLGYRVSRSSNVNNSYGGYLLGCSRRFYQLLMPYFVWSFILFCWSHNYTMQNLMQMIVCPDAYFWFLWVLFWISALFKLAQLAAFKLKLNEMVTILGTSLLLFCVMVVFEIRILGFQFLAYYFLFYTVGYCLHKYENTVLLKGLGNPYAMAVMTILWAFFAWGWTMHGLPSWLPVIPHVPSTLLQYAYRGFTALVAIVVLIGAAPRFLNGTGRLNQLFCTIGVVSLGLYVVHLSIIGYIITFIQTAALSLDNWMCIALVFVIALVISYFAVWLLNKNKHTARIFLGKI